MGHLEGYWFLQNDEYNRKQTTAIYISVVDVFYCTLSRNHEPPKSLKIHEPRIYDSGVFHICHALDIKGKT